MAENKTGIVQQTMIYKTAGGLALPADVIHARGTQHAPAILWLHGGALIRGSRTGLGHSAGGYLTLLSGICLSPKPAALVSFYGYGDIVGDWYSQPDPFYCRQRLVTDVEAAQAVGQAPLSASNPTNNDARGRYYLYTRQRGLWPRALTGHDPAREPEYFDPYCPVRHVTADYPPVMLLHGDADTDVPVEQSIDMAAACERVGAGCVLKVLPGRGHGFDNAGLDDPEISAVFDEAVQFLGRELNAS